MRLINPTLFLYLLSVLPLTIASRPISSLKSGVAAHLSQGRILSKRDVDPSTLYPAHNLSVPIDHFHNESMYEPHSSGTFNLRYFFDATYYKAGGPVIVLESGEDDATDRLPYLQKGIIHQLAEATGGIAVVLEHRYYGTSFPTPDLSTENLRFLTTQQALADTDYFARNVVFEGLEDKDLTAPHTPYIAYGGSYAGAFVAFLRKTYPDTYFGAISSSGVTKAIYDYWEYYEPVREYGPPDCILATQQLTNIVDNILLGNTTKGLIKELKTAFGLQDVEYNDDFASVLGTGVAGWQGRNWDPAVNDPSFSQYCGNITANDTLYPATASLTRTVKQLVAAGGYGSQSATLTTQMLNLISYLNTTSVQPCIAGGQTTNECYTTHNATFYALDDITQTWRSWPYQYCSQWGFLQPGSTVTKDQLPLISRTITLSYESIICRDAFNITTPSDTAIINAYGGYTINYDKLAFLDGEDDPWRGATPHAPEAEPRTSTTDEPFILIQGAVHHWDENGLFPNETTATLPPAPVKEAQMDEVAFVKAWMAEWRAGKL
ncbi:peptidase S28 [Usnea florida]